MCVCVCVCVFVCVRVTVCLCTFVVVPRVTGDAPLPPHDHANTQSTEAVLLTQIKRLGWLLLFFEYAEPARAVY